MWEWELEWSTVWAARDPARSANRAEGEVEQGGQAGPGEAVDQGQAGD